MAVPLSEIVLLTQAREIARQYALTENWSEPRLNELRAGKYDAHPMVVCALLALRKISDRDRDVMKAIDHALEIRARAQADCA